MNKTATIQLRNLTIGYKGKVRPKIVAENICSDIYAGELTFRNERYWKIHPTAHPFGLPAQIERRYLPGWKKIGKIYGQSLIHGDQCRVDRKM